MGRSNNNCTSVSGESGPASYLSNNSNHHHTHNYYSHHSGAHTSQQLPSPPPHSSSQYLTMSHLTSATPFYDSTNNITPPVRIYSPSSHGSSSSGSSSLSPYGGGGGGGHNGSNGSLSIMEAMNGSSNSVKYEFEDFPQEPDGGPVKISTWKDHVAVFNIDQVGVMCDVLLQESDMPRLLDLLSTIAKDFIGRSEKILRAQAHVAFHAALDDARKFPQVYKILEAHPFSLQYHSGLQKLWFTAHYKEAEITRGRPLGAVDKYRIRRKFPLPRTIWDGEETVYCFKERSRNALRESFQREKYPNLEEKKKLSKETGLTMTQVGNWFKNKRQREKEKQQGKAAVKRPKSAYSTPVALAAAMTPDLIGMMLNTGAGGGSLSQNHLSPHHPLQQQIAPMSPEDFENAIRKARYADVDAHRLKTYIDESMYSTMPSSTTGPSNLSSYLHGSGNNVANSHSSEPSPSRHLGLAGKNTNTVGIGSPGAQQQSQQHSPRSNNGLTITAIPSPNNNCNPSASHLQIQHHSPGETSRNAEDGSPGNATEINGVMYANRPKSNSSTASSGGVKYGADLVVPYLHSGGHHPQSGYHPHFHHHQHHHGHHHSAGSPLPVGYDGIVPLIHNNVTPAALSHA